jgi:hypothetical protein
MYYGKQHCEVLTNVGWLLVSFNIHLAAYFFCNLFGITQLINIDVILFCCHIGYHKKLDSNHWLCIRVGYQIIN